MEVNGNASNIKWNPTNLGGALINIHVRVVKASDVPDFALCARSEKLTKDDLSEQTKSRLECSICISCPIVWYSLMGNVGLKAMPLKPNYKTSLRKNTAKM